MQILREAEEFGTTETCRKYDLANSLFYRWKSQFNARGIEGLTGQYHRVDPAVRDLEKENERLKKIIARQALELEVKGEYRRAGKERQSKVRVEQVYSGPGVV